MAKQRFESIIAPIKLIREIGATADVTVEKNLQGEYVVKATTSGQLGLKEAKDLVEDIMELGVRRYLQDQLKKLGAIPLTRQFLWCSRCLREMDL